MRKKVKYMNAKLLLNGVTKVAKVSVKYAGPLLAGAITVVSEIESMQLKNTVKELAKRVAELEKK